MYSVFQQPTGAAPAEARATLGRRADAYLHVSVIPIDMRAATYHCDRDALASFTFFGLRARGVTTFKRGKTHANWDCQQTSHLSCLHGRHCFQRATIATWKRSCPDCCRPDCYDSKGRALRGDAVVRRICRSSPKGAAYR